MISFPFLVHTASAHGRTAHTRCGRCGSAWMWPGCAASRSDWHVAVPRIGSDARIPTHGHPGGTQQALRTPTRPPRRHGTITTSVVHPDTSTVPPQGERGQGANDPTWDRPRRNPAMSGTKPAHHTRLGGPSDAAPLPASSRTGERLRHAPAVHQSQTQGTRTASATLGRGSAFMSAHAATSVHPGGGDAGAATPVRASPRCVHWRQ